MVDIVYMVRDGETNEELRYSLRSLKNIPHGNVIFAGHMPSWVRNVTHIRRQQVYHSKYINTTRNLMKVCRDPRVSDDFILMNDDFFIMKPIEFLPNYHRGPLLAVERYYRNLGATSYALGIEQTKNYMISLGLEPTKMLSYELHVPMNFNKKNFMEMITQQQATMNIPVVHKRTLYGNLFHKGGIRMNDVKIFTDTRPDPDATFLSSDDTSFERYHVGEYIRKQFQDKSPYEL